MNEISTLASFIAVGATLRARGWDTSDYQRFADATKTFATAVGPKQAHARVRLLTAGNVIHIDGDYWSEGRNVIAVETRNAVAGDLTAAEDQAMAFCDAVEAQVDQTYAVRLAKTAG
jgi:hypothetical protein